MKHLIFLLMVPCAVFSQKAKVHGVVTYFFNDYQGDKPDLGAKVYLLDSTKFLQYDKEVAFQYDLATISNNPKEKPGFDSIDIRFARMNLAIKNSEFVNSTTVDASGTYILEVAPGTYYLLIESKGRNKPTVSEVMGRLYWRTIRVQAEQTIDISHNFRID